MGVVEDCAGAGGGGVEILPLFAGGGGDAGAEAGTFFRESTLFVTATGLFVVGRVVIWALTDIVDKAMTAHSRSILFICLWFNDQIEFYGLNPSLMM